MPAFVIKVLGRRTWRFLLWVFVFTLVSSLVFHFLIFVFFHDFHELIYPQLKAFFSGGREVLDDPEVSLALEYLVDSGVVVTVDQFLSGIYSFYQTIIALLIALLALVSGLAYFSIKGISAEKAEAVGRTKVDDYFKSTNFSERVQLEVYTRIQNENMGIGEVYEKVDQLEDEIYKLRKEVSDLTMNSSEGGELILE